MLNYRASQGGVVCAAASACSLLLLTTGCSTAPAPSGVNYSSPPTAQTSPPPPSRPVQEATVPPRKPLPVGGQGDAQFERSSLLIDTFYRNPDLLLQQVDKSGAMGVNRGWEMAARKGVDWYIEEQRFADTVIGAGVSRHRADLIDAGIRALEWGFAQQAADGGFPCKDSYLSTSYFVAAAGHSLWLLQSTGMAKPYEARLNALRAPLERAGLWLLNNAAAQSSSGQYDTYVSRYFLTGYALGVAGLVSQSVTLWEAGERSIALGISKQLPTGVIPEKGGFDASFQSEALVYFARYVDHVASLETRRLSEPALRLGLKWLERRVTAQGVILSTGNTRTGNGQERDRTGQPRRISAVAVARAFGLARFVLDEPAYDRLARAIAGAKQPA